MRSWKTTTSLRRSLAPEADLPVKTGLDGPSGQGRGDCPDFRANEHGTVPFGSKFSALPLTAVAFFTTACKVIML